MLVSIALPRSRLHALVEAWQQGRCRLLLSQDILDEYLRVLTYPKFQLSTEDIKRMLDREVRPYVERVQVTTKVDLVRDDPSDNKFLACAADGRANTIVNGDRHLLALQRFRDIPITTARQFLGMLAFKS